MSSRHLVTRAKEHLNLNDNRKSTNKDHLQHCKSCTTSEINLHLSLTILKKCSSEYNTKTHEGLLATQSKLLLNKQLYANSCFLLLKIV